MKITITLERAIKSKERYGIHSINGATCTKLETQYGPHKIWLETDLGMDSKKRNLVRNHKRVLTQEQLESELAKLSEYIFANEDSKD